MSTKVTTHLLEDGILSADTAGRSKMAAGFVTGAKIAAGMVVQIASSMDAAVATTTTTTADADSPPTTSHGAQFLSQAITPQSATNILRIDVVANVASSFAGSNIMTLGLHQDATANAIAAVQKATGAQHVQTQLVLTHYMVAGTTDETTFKARIGGSAAGTTTFNGSNGARKMGGVMASSITVTEIKA
jgi:hypothetical protein